MQLDHIGIVVPSLEEGLKHWEELFGYRKNSDVVVNSRQKVRVVFLAKKDSLTVKRSSPLNAPVQSSSLPGGAEGCITSASAAAT